MRRRTVWTKLLGPLLLLAACGDDQDPAGAAELWNRIRSENYRNWARAPGFEQRRSSNAAHGDAVDIYVNTIVADTLAGGPVPVWPKGSLIVKDGFDGGDFDLVAAMEKRDDGWFWAEWDNEGDAMYSGRPDTCTDCHASGSDFVRAFALPK